jgi:glycine/D-amino acid oxidase-like deaminating enzyme
VTEYYDDRNDDSTIWYKKVVPKYRRVLSKDLPPGARIGFKYQSMTVNPEMFLPWIKERLDEKGVRFIQREVKSIQEARSILKTSLVVNATGLGALDLTGDQKVLPVRGQTMLIEGYSDEIVLFQGSHYTYQIPRMCSGTTVIGGIAQEGNLDHEPDPELRNDILRRINLVTGDRYRDMDLDKLVIQDLVGFRPSREGGHRLEEKEGVVHAYGFGSLGYTYCYGVALAVRELIKAANDGRKPTQSKL